MDIDTLTLAPFIKISFYLILAGFSVFTMILYYHWHHYSTDNKASLLTALAYSVVTIPLLLCMATIAFVYF